MQEYQLFVLMSVAIFCLIGILFIVMINVVGFAEYLSSRNANSKENAIDLDKDAKRRYALIIPFANTSLGILRKTNGKYWLRAKNNAGIKVWYVILMTIFLSFFAFAILSYISTLGFNLYAFPRF